MVDPTVITRVNAVKSNPYLKVLPQILEEYTELSFRNIIIFVIALLYLGLDLVFCSCERAYQHWLELKESRELNDISHTLVNFC